MYPCLARRPFYPASVFLSRACGRARASRASGCGRDAPRVRQMRSRTESLLSTMPLPARHFLRRVSRLLGGAVSPFWPLTHPCRMTLAGDGERVRERYMPAVRRYLARWRGGAEPDPPSSQIKKKDFIVAPEKSEGSVMPNPSPSTLSGQRGERLAWPSVSWTY